MFRLVAVIAMAAVLAMAELFAMLGRFAMLGGFAGYQNLKFPDLKFPPMYRTRP
jgi:hypothetical protein